MGFVSLMFYHKTVCVLLAYTFFFIILMKKGSIVSEASYIGDQQKTLMEVLSYCQVFLFLLPSHGIETILGNLLEDLKSVFDNVGLQPFQLFTGRLSLNCCIFNERIIFLCTLNFSHHSWHEYFSNLKL